MKTISLKLQEEVLEEIDAIAVQLSKPRNRYITEALDLFNKIQKRRLIAAKLKQESGLVQLDNMDILKDFEALEYAD